MRGAARRVHAGVVAQGAHLAAVAREPRLLQQLAKLGVVHRLPLVAGLEGGGIHKLAAAGGRGRGGGRGDGEGEGRSAGAEGRSGWQWWGGIAAC